VRISDFPAEGLFVGNVSSPTLGIALTFVSAAYGGLRFSAWNNFFFRHRAFCGKISAIVVVAVVMAAASVIVSEKFIYDSFQFYLISLRRVLTLML
jgi:hypothetical protein